MISLDLNTNKKYIIIELLIKKYVFSSYIIYHKTYHNILCYTVSYHVKHITWNRVYDPWRIEQDKKLKATLHSIGIKVQSFNGSLLWEPWEIVSRATRMFFLKFSQVFGSFRRFSEVLGSPPRFSEVLGSSRRFLEVLRGSGKLYLLHFTL